MRNCTSGCAPRNDINLGVSHQDQVLSLPPGAELVAQNTFCEYAALAYPGVKAMSFQGHPEYSPAFSCALYGIRKGRQLPIEMVDAAEASFSEPLDNDLVGSWMARFVRQATN